MEKGTFKIKKKKKAETEAQLPEVQEEKKDKGSFRDKMSKLSAAVLAVTLTVNVAGILLAPDQPDSAEINAALTPSYVIEESVDMAPSADDATVDDQEDEEKKQKKISAYSIFAYIAGCIVSFVSSLLLTVLTPIATTVIGWVIFAAAVFGAIIIGLKKAFPDVPLKELLTKKNVCIIGIFIAAVIALCEVFAYYYRDYMIWFKIAAYAAGIIFVVYEYNKISNRFAEKWTGLKKALS